MYFPQRSETAEAPADGEMRCRRPADVHGAVEHAGETNDHGWRVCKLTGKYEMPP